MQELARMYEQLRKTGKKLQKQKRGKKWIHNFGLRHEVKIFELWFSDEKNLSNFSWNLEEEDLNQYVLPNEQKLLIEIRKIYIKSRN